MAKKQQEPVTIKFTGATKHQGLRFGTAAYAFEDPAHADYFVRAGWAEPSEDEPIDTIGADEMTVDPETRSNETGLKVMDVVSTGDSAVEG